MWDYYPYKIIKDLLKIFFSLEVIIMSSFN